MTALVVGLGVGVVVLFVEAYRTRARVRELVTLLEASQSVLSDALAREGAAYNYLEQRLASYVTDALLTEALAKIREDVARNWKASGIARHELSDRVTIVERATVNLDDKLQEAAHQLREIHRELGSGHPSGGA